MSVNDLSTSDWPIDSDILCNKSLPVRFYFDFNPFMHNGISHCYQFDQCISISRVVGLYFILIQILIEQSVSKQWIPWSDAAICGVWSGSALFAIYPQEGR